MSKLRLESDNGVLSLSELEASDTAEYGIQAVAGVTGMGLPPITVQWSEGAGDGATYQGHRILARPIDIPITVLARSNAELAEYASRLAKILAAPLRLVWTDEDGSDWATDVMRTGGGEWTTGATGQGSTDGKSRLETVVTVQAGDPYFSAVAPLVEHVGNDVHGLLASSLSQLWLSPTQTWGAVWLTNPGDADAYPLWTMTGPFTSFSAMNADGVGWTWTGSIAKGQTLFIDTRTGQAYDQDGTNRYDGFATRPKFWSLPPGVTAATVDLEGTVAGVSDIEATWHPRRWVNI